VVFGLKKKDLLKKVGFGKAKSRNLLVSFFRGTAENYNIAEEEEHSGPGRFALSKLLPGPDFFSAPKGVFFDKKQAFARWLSHIWLI